MRKNKRKFSLKWGFIIIVIACWVVPILVIIGTLGSFTMRNIESQIADTITTNAENMVTLSQNMIESAIKSSRAASYDRDIWNAYSLYRQDHDEISLYSSVTSYLVSKYRDNNQFISTFLYFCEEPNNVYYANNRASSGSFTKVREYRSNMHSIVQEAASKSGTEIIFLSDGEKLYMVRNMVDSKFQPFAVIIMELNRDVLFDSVRSVVWIEGASVYFNSIRSDVIGEPVSLPEYEINLNQPILEKKDGRYDIFIRKKVEGQTISYAITTNQSLLSDDIPNFQRMIWLLILFTVPLMALVIWIFYRFISKPISAMIEASQKIESGEIGYQIQPLPDSNEFNYLTERFNSMSHQLKVQFERSYQEQIALQDARIKALQSQIDPHFLNNTLETINWEARISGDEKVSNMIEALSTMLSAATARGGETMISLAEELTYVNAYLYIISVRFGKRLTVKQEIDEALLDEKVPRLVMQPIVENAIEHGIAPHRNGDLILRIYRQEEKIVMEVENSGELTDADKEAVDRLLNWDGNDTTDIKPGRLGIRNVNLRLKFLYGKECGLTITSLPNQRTLARIILLNQSNSSVSLYNPDNQTKLYK